MTALAVVGVFLLLLTVSVTLHEWAHLKVGRWAGIAVKSLNVGFGFSCVSWRRKGVDYRVSVLPLGGYVHFYGGRRPGERPDKWNEQAPEGAGMNWWEAPLSRKLAVGAAGSAVNLTVGTACLIWFDAVTYGAVRAPAVLWDSFLLMIRVLGALLINPLQGLTDASLMGPVGAIREFTSLGVTPLTLLALLAVINLSLGIFNMFPVPPLDGGMMLLNVVDEVFRKWWRPLPDGVVAGVMAAGGAWIALTLIGVFAGDFL